jgi:protein gp37
MKMLTGLAEKDKTSMGTTTHINWTEHTWNPWQGCRKVSPGCKFCYMYRDKERYGQDPKKVVRSTPATFNKPLGWKEPARVFTCSWSDWFIEEADAWRDEAWDIIKRTPHLTYQILTKRPERIADHLPADWGEGYLNVWLGVSVESQEYANERIPLLLQAPAQVRFLSCEPLLGPLDLEYIRCPWCNEFEDDCPMCMADADGNWINSLLSINWVITGGESGPKARPAQLEWFKSIRDQCQSNYVAYHHKQHGGWHRVNGEWGGRELDGKTWDELPRLISLVS